MSEWIKNETIYIHWLISTYCNYKCPYCSQSHQKNRKYYGYKYLAKKFINNPFKWLTHISYMKKNSAHAFDNYSSEVWTQSFEKMRHQSISLTITGGEPFFDAQNFKPLLVELSKMSHIKCIRFDTNGSWKAYSYKGVDWKNIYLNISYHPLMVKRDIFIDSIKEKIDNGINISMVNFVLEPNQISEFYIIKYELEKINIYVNPAIYNGDLKQIDEGYKIYNKYIPEVDMLIREKKISTKDKWCSYPCYSYYLHPTGMINVGCFASLEGNFIKGIMPARFQDKVKCPSDYCGCIHMYAFLDLVGRGKKLNLLEEYVDICKQKINLDTKYLK